MTYQFKVVLRRHTLRRVIRYYFVLFSQDWPYFSSPYPTIHDNLIASLDGKICDVETAWIFKNLWYFICTFIRSVTFTFYEKQN